MAANYAALASSRPELSGLARAEMYLTHADSQRMAEQGARGPHLSRPSCFSRIRRPCTHRNRARRGFSVVGTAGTGGAAGAMQSLCSPLDSVDVPDGSANVQEVPSQAEVFGFDSIDTMY